MASSWCLLVPVLQLSLYSQSPVLRLLSAIILLIPFIQVGFGLPRFSFCVGIQFFIAFGRCSFPILSKRCTILVVSWLFLAGRVYLEYLLRRPLFRVCWLSFLILISHLIFVRSPFLVSWVVRFFYLIVRFHFRTGINKNILELWIKIMNSL